MKILVRKLFAFALAALATTGIIDHDIFTKKAMATCDPTGLPVVHKLPMTYTVICILNEDEFIFETADGKVLVYQ